MVFVRILILLVLVLINGFFVAAEFALVKIRMSQVEPLARQGRLSAKAASSVLRNLNAYLSACQLGITLASLGLGWIGEPVVAELLKPVVRLFGLSAAWAHAIALPAAFATITFLHITLGEQAPKILAIQKYRGTALAVSPPLVFFYYVFRPLIVLINGTSSLILRVFLGLRFTGEHGSPLTAEELRLMVAETLAGGSVSRMEHLVIRGVLDLERKVARQIMVPRPDIIFMDSCRTLRDNIKVVLQSGKTRFPLCEGHLDRVVGVVHTRDLLETLAAGQSDKPLAKLARPVLFVPETLGLKDLLLAFKRHRTHLALLVDEYGGLSGLVTLEDVLEELVGQIEDEFDHQETMVMSQGAGRFLVNGRCPLDDLREQCGLVLPEVKADTAGGLVTELLGHIPRKGETLEVGRHRIEVLEALPTRVKRIEIQPIERDGLAGSDDGGEP